MQRASVWALSLPLGIIGYVLSIVAVCLLGSAIWMFLVAYGVIGETNEAEIRKELADELRAQNIADALVRDFEEDGTVDTPHDDLGFQQREAIDDAELQYRASKAGEAVGKGIVAIVGASLAYWCVSSGVVLLIAGLLLSLRRRVWLCKSCQYIVRRA
ncbi:MAG: hypothetical protein H8E37_05565 [Planctomycetes bacterium]|nr:hypothetical protein [Planctomycetota bacterium]